MAPFAAAYLVSLLRGLRFGFGIWVLYYLRITDYAGIGITETFTILAALLFEVPTGWIADRVGRKPTVLASLLSETVGYLLLVLAADLPALVGALLVLQTGRSLFSGAFEALLYEALRERGAERLYARLLGRVRGTQLAATAIATLVGGFLYGLDPRAPFIAAASAFALALLAGLGLHEPREPPPRPAHARTTFSPTRSLSALRPVATLLVLSAFLVVPDEVLDDVLAVELGFAAHELGLLFASAYLLAAFCAARSAWLAKRFGRRRSLLVLSLLMAASLVATPVLGMLAGGVAIMLRYAGRAVHDTLLSSLLNERLQSRHRATMLSVYNALGNAPYVALAFPIGLLMDVSSARIFAAYFGVVQLGAVCAVSCSLLRSGLRDGGS